MAANFYDVLGVARDANEKDIKKAYRAKALEVHPDKNDSEDAAAKFILVNEAFSILSDKNMRAEYNTKLDAAMAARANERDAYSKHRTPTYKEYQAYQAEKSEERQEASKLYKEFDAKSLNEKIDFLLKLPEEKMNDFAEIIGEKIKEGSDNERAFNYVEDILKKADDISDAYDEMNENMEDNLEEVKSSMKEVLDVYSVDELKHIEIVLDIKAEAEKEKISKMDDSDPNKKLYESLKQDFANLKEIFSEKISESSNHSKFTR